MFFATPPQSDAALAIFRNFGETAFRKLAANLLQIGLGNQGHVGIAPFVYHQYALSDRWDITSRGALEYLLPRTEKRFFILRKNLEMLNASCPVVVGQEAQQLAFLNQTLIQTVIPSVFSTQIYPGFIFKAASCLSGSIGRRWEVGLGADAWWQSAERFGTIHADRQALNMIRKGIAKRPSAYQAKIMARVMYIFKPRNYDIALMLQGDYSVLNRSIGKDFTLALKLMIDL